MGLRLQLCLSIALALLFISTNGCPSWSQSILAESGTEFNFTFGFKHTVNHTEFVNRHTPSHPSYHYGVFKTRHEVRSKLSEKMADCRATVLAYMATEGISTRSVTDYDEYYEATTTVGKMETIMNASFYQYTNGDKVIVRLDRQSTNRGSQFPSNVDECVGFWGRIWDFPFTKGEFAHKTYARRRVLDENESKPNNRNLGGCQPQTVCPSTWQTMYNFPDGSGVTPNSSMYQSVFEWSSSETQGGQQVTTTWSQSDLFQYLTEFGYPESSFTPTGSSSASGSQGTCSALDTAPCGEANLDTQVLLAANSVPTSTSQNLMFYINDQTDFNTMAANTDWSVISVMSYSYTRPESIDDRHSCDELQSMTSQGVSIFVSAGDQGANGGCTGSCAYNPTFFNTCPYVTSVGGTYGFEMGTEVAAQQSSTCAITTGGGFSSIFTTANGYDLSWQQTQVSKYVSDYLYTSVGGLTTSNNPDATSNNRAYPDISLAACQFISIVGGETFYTSGTSAAAPLMAGAVSLMAYRNNMVFGWINPVLYSKESIFYDVLSGSNYCGNYDQGSASCYQSGGEVYGYFASPNWDPLTGVGTLGTSSSFISLENALIVRVNPNAPTHAPNSARIQTGSLMLVFFYLLATF